MDVKKRSDGSLVPELLLEKPLDREKQSDYRLVLTAVDGGNPPRSGTAELRVSVLDVNDNAPGYKQAWRIAELTQVSLAPGQGHETSARSSKGQLEQLCCTQALHLVTGPALPSSRCSQVPSPLHTIVLCAGSCHYT